MLSGSDLFSAVHERANVRPNLRHAAVNVTVVDDSVVVVSVVGTGGGEGGGGDGEGHDGGEGGGEGRGGGGEGGGGGGGGGGGEGCGGSAGHSGGTVTTCGGMRVQRVHPQGAAKHFERMYAGNNVDHKIAKQIYMGSRSR